MSRGDRALSLWEIAFIAITLVSLGGVVGWGACTLSWPGRIHAAQVRLIEEQVKNLKAEAEAAAEVRAAARQVVNSTR